MSGLADYKTVEVLTSKVDNKKAELPKDLSNPFEDTTWRTQKDYFHIFPHEEPHARRRAAIKQKYGKQIEELEKVKDPRSFYLAVGITVVQLTIAYYIQRASWTVFLLVMYIVGATLNHTMQALVHDLTHYTAFHNILLNKIGALITNIPTVTPSAITFGKYHWEHHLHMGDPEVDADLPTPWEIRTFNTPIKKLIFVFLHPFFYALRPLLVMPKPPKAWELINWVVIIISNTLIYNCLGKGAFGYLLLSTYFSMGLHPAAMHMIAEHYEFVKGQESYNYYGIWNIFNLNLGYHIEHHDFPFLPWSQLPKLHEIAKEFYEGIPYHTSYFKVGLKYIFDDNIGPYARIDSTDKFATNKKKN